MKKRINNEFLKLSNEFFGLFLLLSVFVIGFFSSNYNSLTNSRGVNFTGTSLEKLSASPSQYNADLSDAQLLYKTQQAREDFDKLVKKLPKNPVKASAVCQEDGQLIVSGIPTTCSTPVFSWEAVRTQAKQGRVIGYNIYWFKSLGDPASQLPQHPLEAMEFGNKESKSVLPETTVAESSFTPVNVLTPGNTYYLFVQTVTDSPHPLLGVGGTLDSKNANKLVSANLLFTYSYR